MQQTCLSNVMIGMYFHFVCVFDLIKELIRIRIMSKN